MAVRVRPWADGVLDGSDIDTRTRRPAGGTGEPYPATVIPVPPSVRPLLLCSRHRLAALAVAVAVVLVVAGCGGNDSATDTPTTVPSTTTEAPTTEAPTTTVTEAPTVAEPGTYAVGSVTDTLVDDTRVTAAQGGEPELAQRTLPLLVLYPAEGAYTAGTDTPDAPPVPGPWPVIVFSHGLGGSGPAYAATLRVWASAGYVVVAPTYPLTSLATPGGDEPDDLPTQPGDVSAIIDGIVEGTVAEPVADVMATERIGIAGHSLGGFTSLATGYNPCCLDDRVDAVAAWAGGYVADLMPQTGEEGGPAVQDGPPLLIVHGDADDTVPYDRAAEAAEAIGPPWWLVTLVGGGHVPPYVQGLGSEASTVVTTATLAFFDAFLKDDPDGIGRLTETVSDAGPEVATLTVNEG